MALLKGRMKDPILYAKVSNQSQSMTKATIDRGVRISIDQGSNPYRYRLGAILSSPGLPKQPMVGSRSHIRIGIPVARLIGGMGSPGVGYVPNTTTPTAPKPTRKYPRDWHGENL